MPFIPGPENNLNRALQAPLLSSEGQRNRQARPFEREEVEVSMTTQKGKMTVEQAGRKGGESTSASHDKEFYQEIGSQGGQNSGGNFRNDPERASEAGRKGGQASGGNFANDRQRASEAGRKGGERSHGGGGNNR